MIGGHWFGGASVFLGVDLCPFLRESEHDDLPILSAILPSVIHTEVYTAKTEKSCLENKKGQFVLPSVPYRSLPF